MNLLLTLPLAAGLLLCGCAGEFAVANGGFAIGAPAPSFTQADFERVVPGTWTRADVERTFGPPDRVESVASWRGPILTYRWRDVQGARMLYSFYIDAQGIVRRAHPSMEVRDRLMDRY
jgi:hypothetical protein